MVGVSWGELLKEAGDSVNTFDPIPDGDYELKIIKAEAGTTNNQKPKITLTTQVTTGAYANRRIWDDLVISADSPKAMGFFFRKMKALGLNQDYFKSEPSMEQVASVLDGRTFRGRIYTDTSYGNPKNRIQTYSASGAQSSGATQPIPAPSTPPAPVPGPTPPPVPGGNVAPPQATPSPWEATAGAPPKPPF